MNIKKSYAVIHDRLESNMAFLTCSHKSLALDKNVTFNAIIPQGCENNSKVLYLLHGLSDDYSSWSRLTSIERYAREHEISVIMPDAGRSFYTDMAHGGAYFSYISDEIISYTRKLFSFSPKREDTFIAGLSMGGYGALKVALRCPGKFGAACSSSGVLDIKRRVEMNQWAEITKDVLGENVDLNESPENLFYLLNTYPPDMPKPRIYQACGTEDYLYEDNLAFKNAISNKGFDYKYEEWSGTHCWTFWDVFIQKALNFMLEK